MKKVIVVYHSQEFGNTGALARLVAQGVREAGDIEVKLVNTNEVQRVDVAEIAACDGVAIGSPDYGSYVAGTIKQLFDDFYVANKAGISVKDKPCVLFMTHGGGGEGAQVLKRLAHNLNVLAEPFVCYGAPPEECAEAIALGRLLGECIET